MTKCPVNGIGAVLLALSGTAKAAYHWNLPTPVTRVATEFYDLHLIMLGVILVIFIGVFGVMFYSIYNHRKSVGHRAEQFHENVTVEIIWAVVPFLIVIVVAWPATKSILNLKDTASPEPQTQLNYAELIEARPLPDRELRGLDGTVFRLSQLRGKWLMLQIDSGACVEVCRQKLLYMRKARLAQGSGAERIELVWILTDAISPLPLLLRDYAGVHVLRLPGDAKLAEFPAAHSSTEYIYVVDPLGNLVLRFPAAPDTGKMIKDLARLLRASRVG